MSNSQVKRPQWRRELQRGNRHAANTKRCCVSEEEKPKVGFVRNAVMALSELTADAMNGRFSSCGAAGVLGRLRRCTCKLCRKSGDFDYFIKSAQTVRSKIVMVF